MNSPTCARRISDYCLKTVTWIVLLLPATFPAPLYITDQVPALPENSILKRCNSQLCCSSWFWILFGSNDDQGFHIDAAPEKGQEYPAA